MLHFHHMAISVANLQKSISFYAALGFKVVYEWESKDNSLRIIHLQLNDATLEIFNYTKSEEPLSNLSSPTSELPITGLKHFALSTIDIHKTKKDLFEAGLCPLSQEITEGRTGIKYFFLKDPDNIFVEIVEDNRKL